MLLNSEAELREISYTFDYMAYLSLFQQLQQDYID